MNNAISTRVRIHHGGPKWYHNLREIIYHLSEVLFWFRPPMGASRVMYCDEIVISDVKIWTVNLEMSTTSYLLTEHGIRFNRWICQSYFWKTTALNETKHLSLIWPVKFVDQFSTFLFILTCRFSSLGNVEVWVGHGKETFWEAHGRNIASMKLIMFVSMLW